MSLDLILETLNEVKSLLKEQNGRVRKNEVEIAAIKMHNEWADKAQAELVNSVKDLECNITNKLKELEARIDNLTEYQIRNDSVITGLKRNWPIFVIVILILANQVGLFNDILMLLGRI